LIQLSILNKFNRHNIFKLFIMEKISIGVDIGGTNTVLGAVDKNGNVLIKDCFPTPTDGNIKEYINMLSEHILSIIHSLENHNKQFQIMGIGIGSPNGNYYKGTIEHAPNLSFKGIIPFISLLKERLPNFSTFVITNDANAAAIGEMIYGGAKNMRNFAMYTLGTGVGSGIVVNGELVYGHDGFAGECGHTIIIPEGRICGCGINGHLEAYCSATGMKRTAFDLLSKYNSTDSILAGFSYNQLEAKNIYEAAVEGDKIALEVFELTGKWLGQGLADTIHHFSPEAIFLFGGPLSSGDFIIQPTIVSMEKHLLPVFKNKIKILPSQLKFGDAAIVGASALVWKEV
jgi:glucokinase